MSTRTPIQIDDDPLAQRLTQVEIPAPPFRAVRPPDARPVVFASATRRRRRVIGAAGLATALLVLVVAAAYPAISQDALRWAGLAPSQVEPVQGSGSFGSATVSVTGGYADPIDTVLFAAFDHAYCDQGPFLTDQFGQKYLPIGGWGVDVGTYPVVFEPLRGSAAAGGAALTLHCVIATMPNGTHDLKVGLSGTLTSGNARSLEAPTEITQDGTTYQVVSLRWSGTYLEVRTRISGKLIDDLVARSNALRTSPPPGGGGVTFPGVFVADSSGHEMIPIAFPNDPSVEAELYGAHVLDETRVFTVRTAGSYRIVVSSDPNTTPQVFWNVNVG